MAISLKHALIATALLTFSMPAIACSSNGSHQVASTAGGGANRSSTPTVAASCGTASRVNARRVASNPKARRLGPVVFTPLALLDTIRPQPYPARGASAAHATKVGATLIGGAQRAQVRISPQGAARLVYGDAFNRMLGSGDVTWAALPSAVILRTCRDDKGRAQPTAFPGGLLFRDDRVCRIRLTVSSAGSVVTRAYSVGFARCRSAGPDS